ncbi:MAG: bis(5'-nucleosyl)-tetraphosphatase (symmetrical) YqeK [Candidatus Firestonebacteria bacterium]
MNLSTEKLEEIKKTVKKILNSARYKHTLSVLKMAILLAEKYNVNVKKTIIASLLHDFGKDISYKKALELLRKSRINVDNETKEIPALLHCLIGEIYARKNFKIKDKDILYAIKFHSTASENMSKLAKIIYIADLAEVNRKFKGVDIIRRTAFKNLNKAMILGLQSKISYLLKRKLPIHSDSIKAWNAVIQTIGIRH